LVIILNDVREIIVEIHKKNTNNPYGKNKN